MKNIAILLLLGLLTGSLSAQSPWSLFDIDATGHPEVSEAEFDRTMEAQYDDGTPTGDFDLLSFDVSVVFVAIDSNGNEVEEEVIDQTDDLTPIGWQVFHQFTIPEETTLKTPVDGSIELKVTFTLHIRDNSNNTMIEDEETNRWTFN